MDRRLERNSRRFGFSVSIVCKEVVAGGEKVSGSAATEKSKVALFNAVKMRDCSGELADEIMSRSVDI